MLKHLLANAKAYVALIGSVAAALLGIYSTGELGHVLTVVVAVATALTTYRVPNNVPANEDGAVSVIEVAVVAIAIVLVLTFFGVHGHLG